MQQLYQVVAVPSYTYAADIWFNPVIWNASDKKAKGSVSMACKLTSVQHIATTTITGTLCTSATDTMELHANLFPVELLMQRVCHRRCCNWPPFPRLTHYINWYESAHIGMYTDTDPHYTNFSMLLVCGLMSM